MIPYNRDELKLRDGADFSVHRFVDGFSVIAEMNADTVLNDEILIYSLKNLSAENTFGTPGILRSAYRQDG